MNVHISTQLQGNYKLWNVAFCRSEASTTGAGPCTPHPPGPKQDNVIFRTTFTCLARKLKKLQTFWKIFCFLSMMGNLIVRAGRFQFGNQPLLRRMLHSVFNNVAWELCATSSFIKVESCWWKSEENTPLCVVSATNLCLKVSVPGPQRREPIGREDSGSFGGSHTVQQA